MVAVPVFAHDSSRTAHTLSSKNMIFEFRSNTKLFVTHRKSCCTIRIILLSSFYSNLQGIEKFELENLQVDWPFKILNSSSQVLIMIKFIYHFIFIQCVQASIVCTSEFCIKYNNHGFTHNSRHQFSKHTKTFFNN